MNMYLKGVNGELNYDELSSICQTKVPKGKYYDYEKIRSVILKKLNNEISDDYFKTWLIVAAWALNNHTHAKISWRFDGFSFCDSFDRKTVLEILAVLKFCDFAEKHQNYVKTAKKEKLKVVFLKFEHCNRTADSGVYKAYFVDFKNKIFDIRFVDDAFFEYDDNLLYCFIDCESEYDEDDESAEEIEKYLMSIFYNENDTWIYDHNLNF